MEIMFDIARKWCYITVIIELAQTDGALIVLESQIVVVKLCFNNTSDDCVTDLSVHLCVLCGSKDSKAYAWKTTS